MRNNINVAIFLEGISMACGLTLLVLGSMPLATTGLSSSVSFGFVISGIVLISVSTFAIFCTMLYRLFNSGIESERTKE